MENIVMASVVGQPVADGNIYSAKNSPKADVLFGMLVNAEITRQTGHAKSSDKKPGQVAADPMILLLMSALLQGFNTQATPTEPIADPNVQPASAESQQAGPVAAASSNDILKELQQLLSANTDATGALKALLAGLGKKNGVLKQLLAAASQHTAEGAGTQAQPSRQVENTFSALLSVLGGTQSQQDASLSAQGNTALSEIRQLFSELIAVEPAAEAQASVIQPVLVKIQQGDAPVSQESPVEDAVAVDRLSGPAKDLLQKMETIIKSMRGEAETGDTQSQGSAITDKETGIANELEPAIAKPKQGEAFDAAMRAYHSNAPTPVAGRAEAKAVAAAAKPGAEAFDSIVQSITQMRGSAQNDMEIQLKPDFLGKVVIKLSMDEGGLVAKIVASNPKVQEAFLNNASSLQSSLADQGLKDVRIVVMSSSVQDPSLQQQADRRGQGQNQQHKRKGLAIDALEKPDIRALTAYEAAYTTGTINYLA